MLRDTRLWGTLAVIAILALLFFFERVVQLAVRQGELRQVLALERSTAAWQCSSMAGLQARKDCRQALP